MTRPKAKKKEAQKNGQVQIQPWNVDPMYRERVYVFLPALLEGMRTLHDDLEEIKTLLEE